MTTYDFGDGNGPVPAHQHANGGGWVADTATVEDRAYVGPNAQVYGSARVCGEARVYGSARVSDSALVCGEARVCDSARVCGEALVCDSAWVTEVCTRDPKVLTGFAHTLTITDHHVRAGCECHPPSVWLERGEAIIRAARIPSKDAKAQAAIIAALIEQHGCTDLLEEPK